MTYGEKSTMCRKVISNNVPGTFGQGVQATIKLRRYRNVRGYRFLEVQGSFRTIQSRPKGLGSSTWTQTRTNATVVQHTKYRSSKTG